MGAELKLLYAAGHLEGALFWRAGIDGWKPLEQLPELGAALVDETDGESPDPEKVRPSWQVDMKELTAVAARAEAAKEVAAKVQEQTAADAAEAAKEGAAAAKEAEAAAAAAGAARRGSIVRQESARLAHELAEREAAAAEAAEREAEAGTEGLGGWAPIGGRGRGVTPPGGSEAEDGWEEEDGYDQAGGYNDQG